MQAQKTYRVGHARGPGRLARVARCVYLAVVSGLRREARHGRVAGRRAHLWALGVSAPAPASWRALAAVSAAAAVLAGCALHTGPRNGRIDAGELDSDSGAATVDAGDGRTRADTILHLAEDAGARLRDGAAPHTVDSGSPDAHAGSSSAPDSSTGEADSSAPTADAGDVGDDAGTGGRPSTTGDAGMAGMNVSVTHVCTARCIDGQYHCPSVGGLFTCTLTPCTCDGPAPAPGSCLNGQQKCPMGADSFYCTSSVCN